MAYGQQNAIGQTMVRPSSLTGDGARLNERLESLYGRLVKLANTMHGSEPRDVGAGKAQRPESSLSQYLTDAHATLDECDSELNRIEGRL